MTMGMAVEARRILSPVAAAQIIRLPEGGTLSTLSQADAWLNTRPLAPADLRGRVVLINFWTYSCINWIRTAPYVRAWAEKYGDQGLVVIGVHTPEFAFEADIDNVRRAAREFGVDYPVAIDNGYTIWRAFDNHYWPALYFIDAQGRMRHHHFGEGDHGRSERILQRLLGEAGRGVRDQQLVTVEPRGVEKDADWKNLRSPETYLGYSRAENFVSPGAEFDEPHEYVIPETLELNQWALAGDWTLKRDLASLNEPGGKLTYRFHARDLHLVMSPGKRGAAVRFRVLVDGQPPGAAHGVDVDAGGHGTVSEPRMYQLIRQPAPVEERQFEIEFLDAGVDVFVFTFG